MGAVVVNFLRWFGTFSIGYFGNDIATAAGNVIKPLKGPDGKITWWGILIIMAVVSIVFMVILWAVGKMFGKKKR